MTRPTYIAARTALARVILENPGDASARAAYAELREVYLAGVGLPAGTEESGVWRATLPAMVRKQAD